MKNKLSFLVGVILLLLLLVGCESSSTTHNFSLSDSDKQVIENYLNEQVMKPNVGCKVFSIHEVLQTDKNAGEIYIWAVIQEFYKTSTGFEKRSGMSVPMVLHIEQKEDSLQISNHTTPGDGSNYSKNIKEMFPKDIHDKIFTYSSKHVHELLDELENKVK